MKAKTLQTLKKGLLWASFLTVLLLPVFLKSSDPGAFHFLSSISILLGVSLLLQAKSIPAVGENRMPTRSPLPESRYPFQSAPREQWIGSMAINVEADITVMEKMFDYRSEQVADDTSYVLQEALSVGRSASRSPATAA